MRAYELPPKCEPFITLIFLLAEGNKYYNLNILTKESDFMTLHVRAFIRNGDEQSEKALKTLAELKNEIPHQLTEIDIDLDPDIKLEFGTRVPVIKTGPYIIEAPFDENEIRLHLLSARDAHIKNEEDQGKLFDMKQERKNKFSKGERATYWYSKHYLLVINLFLAIYVGLPFLAPMLEKAGYTDASSLIYRAYRYSCHQLAFRSFFLFGDQPIYPREAAGIEGYVTFQDATGINERDIYESQKYIGDEHIGYKVALCERDLAIFGAMLLFGIYFWASGRRVKQIPFIWVIIVGFVPLGIDGFSQLLTEFPWFTLWDFRESTPFLRVLTGSMLGMMLGWYGYPLFEETMKQTRTALAAKFYSIPEIVDEEN